MTMVTASFTQINFRLRTVSPTTAAANAAFGGSDPAINTNTSINVTSGNQSFRARFEIDETAGGSENVTWNLYYSKNGGTYTQVTASSSNVRTVDNTTYADDTATTNLISGSSRTFLAGYADESEASFVGWLVCLDGDAAGGLETVRFPDVAAVSVPGLAPGNWNVAVDARVFVSLGATPGDFVLAERVRQEATFARSASEVFSVQ